MAKRKNDVKWEKIFFDKRIEEKINKNGYYYITAKEIKPYREPRLMTKFDYKSTLPDIFRENNLRILPVSRGEYIIGNFQAYQDIYLDKQNLNLKKVSMPPWLESINPKDLYSEDAALKGAFVSGILHDVVERKKLVSTVGGRMSTGTFNFNINDFTKGIKQNFKVENSQCEIDGGYETEDKFILIEAKNSYSDDFLVRQLYYPYRLWSKKINKEVVPIFMVYSDDIYNFFVYNFEDPYDYNSLRLISQKNYTIVDREITIEDIKEIFFNVKIKKDPPVPFPQADTFGRILDILKTLYIENLDAEDVESKYDIKRRQGDYYISAIRYLGLVEPSEDGKYKLNKKGNKIMEMDRRERNLALVEAILEHEFFNKAFKLYLFEGKVSKKYIANIMIDNRRKIYNNLGDTTIRRRARSVIGWIEWILSLPERS
ncbi:MAG: type II restriction enzyme [bacterium]